MAQEITFCQQREENAMRHRLVGASEATIVDEIFAGKVNAKHGTGVHRFRCDIFTGK